MAINSRYLQSGQKAISFGQKQPPKKKTEKNKYILKVVHFLVIFLNVSNEEKKYTGLVANIPTDI